MMTTIESLNEVYGINGSVTFYEGKGRLQTVAVKNKHAAAELSLYGAQLLSFIPAGKKDILWMSEKSLFEEGKAIRGGIPLCFPWFGPHLADKEKPQHGFGRLQSWTVEKVKETADGGTIVCLSLTASAASLQMWAYQFKATAEFHFGKRLEVKLVVSNTGNSSFEYSDALHTYFNISDIKNISVEGLQDAVYYDAFGTDLLQQEEALLHFTKETNRRYVNTISNCIIHDKKFGRKISVGKTGSKVTVVWNPGEATTKTIADMAPDGYKTFVCVEPANAYPGIDIIHLEPGQNHTLSTIIEIIE